MTAAGAPPNVAPEEEVLAAKIERRNAWKVEEVLRANTATVVLLLGILMLLEEFDEALVLVTAREADPLSAEEGWLAREEEEEDTI